MRALIAGGVLYAALVMPAVASPTLADCDAEGFATVLQPAAALLEARALWLDPWLLRWPGVEADGHVRLHHSADGRMTAKRGHPVAGADGSLALQVHSAAP